MDIIFQCNEELKWGYNEASSKFCFLILTVELNRELWLSGSGVFDLGQLTATLTMIHRMVHRNGLVL